VIVRIRQTRNDSGAMQIDGRVFEPWNFFASAFEPTKTMRSSLTAIASACGRVALAV
jgi:hypothetical protein